MTNDLDPIQRVLRAEREAQQKLAQARQSAEARVRAARQQAKAIRERNEARSLGAVDAYTRRQRAALAREIADLESEAQQGLEERRHQMEDDLDRIAERIVSAHWPAG